MTMLEEAIDRLRSAYPSLPVAYFNFLKKFNGVDCELGVDPGWVVIWPAEDALVATNQYQMSTFLPGFFAFGGNGAGEVFVLPVDRQINECPVYMVPGVGMSKDELIVVAPSFGSFEEQIGKPFDEVKSC